MTDPDYADMALKFVEHFLWIASSMTHLGGDTGHVGRGGRLLLRRAAPARRPGPAAQGPVDGRPAAAVRGHGLRGRAAGEVPRGRRSGFEWFLEARPELCAAIHDPRKPGVAGRRLASILDETKLRRVLAKMLDENEFLSQFGIRSLSRYHADHPVRHPRRRPGVPRRLPAGRVRHRHVRRQLELARPDLDAGQRPDHPGPAAVLHLLRRRLHRRMPDRLRPADEPVPGGRGDRAPAGRTSSCKDKDGRRPVYGGTAEVPGGPALARSASCSTSTSTATTGPASGPATRPAGPASSPGSCTCSRPSRPSRPWRAARGRTSSGRSERRLVLCPRVNPGSRPESINPEGVDETV